MSTWAADTDRLTQTLEMATSPVWVVPQWTRTTDDGLPAVSRTCCEWGTPPGAAELAAWKTAVADTLGAWTPLTAEGAAALGLTPQTPIGFWAVS